MSDGKRYVVVVDCGRFYDTQDEAIAGAASRSSKRRAIVAEVRAYTDAAGRVVFGVPGIVGS